MDNINTLYFQILLSHAKGRTLIEERDRYNNTALHMASSKGHVNAVKVNFIRCLDLEEH